jgi:hypothetical protein
LNRKWNFLWGLGGKVVFRVGKCGGGKIAKKEVWRNLLELVNWPNALKVKNRPVQRKSLMETNDSDH